MIMLFLHLNDHIDEEGKEEGKEERNEKTHNGFVALLCGGKHRIDLLFRAELGVVCDINAVVVFVLMAFYDAWKATDSSSQFPVIFRCHVLF